MDLTGFYIAPDQWPAYGGNILIRADDYSDDSFPGCQYRLPSCGGNLAVNVTITGRKSHYTGFSNRYKTRIKIEYVGDGTPSQFDRGFVFSDGPLI